MNSLVYIIILTYNGKKWIDNCLTSVLKTNYPNYRVLVVDNASKDGSADYIKEKFPQVELIRNKKNYGFAEGNNIGMRYALKQDAEYIVLLNQDTKVDKNWIEELVKAAESNDQIGILSPMQYDYEGKMLDKNFLNNILKPYTTYEENLKNNRVREIYHVNEIIGASLMISALLVRKIGLFDSLYFLYAEEYDLCRRACYHGFKIGVIRNSKIYHWHSLIQNNVLSKKNRYIFFRSRFLYYLKDPNGKFIKNLYGYYCKRDGLKLAGGLKALKNFRYLARYIQAQLWIIFYLSVIAYHHYHDRKLKARLKA